MHGTYLFLLSGIEEGPEALSQATGFFESRYAEHWCDENNWWRIICLSVEDGASYLSPEASGEQPLSFEEAWQLSGQIAYSELGTYMDLGINPYSIGPKSEQDRRIRKLDAAELVTEGLALAANELAGRYGELAQKQILTPTRSSAPPKELDLDMDGWRRKRLAQCVEHMSRGEHAPFSTDTTTPYEWRLFDLTDGEREKVFSILAVDIHT